MARATPRGTRPRARPAARRWPALLAAGLALAAAAVVALALWPAGEAEARWQVVTTDGQTMTSQSLAGKVYALDFFFLECPICKRQLPENRDLVQSLANRSDFVFLSVTGDPSDTRELVDAHRERDGAPWPHATDAAVLYREFEVLGNPNIVFVDRHGAVRETVTQVTAAGDLEAIARRLLDEA